MAKYNMFNELMNALRSESTGYSIGKGIEGTCGFTTFFKEFTAKAKQVGDKIVTRFDIPDTHGTFHDHKIIDMVQDMNGNILGIRSEIYDTRGVKLAVDKITPNIKSETHFSSGVRWNRYYDNQRCNPIYYLNGAKPI